MTKEQASREIDSLDFYLQNHTDDYGEESHTAMMMAKDALNSSEKTEMGHWIEENKGLFGIYPRCSKCNELYHTKEKYCPNCGAKMESED